MGDQDGSVDRRQMGLPSQLIQSSNQRYQWIGIASFSTSKLTYALIKFTEG
jgi:hypothetical protein